MEIKAILLGLLPKSKERTMSRKFVLLGLVLAKRRIAIRWLSRVRPRLKEWRKDILEWALAEEVHMKKSRRDEKLEDDILSWSAMIEGMRPREDSEVTMESSEVE